MIDHTTLLQSKCTNYYLSPRSEKKKHDRDKLFQDSKFHLESAKDMNSTIARHYNENLYNEIHHSKSNMDADDMWNFLFKNVCYYVTFLFRKNFSNAKSQIIRILNEYLKLKTNRREKLKD